MDVSKKIILFELNEVPYRLLDDYVRRYPKSNFAQFVARSDQYTTVDEERQPTHLSPWVTWPTLHRGISKSQHNIYNLGQVLDEPDKNFPPIWEILSRAGINVGVFSSLHTGQLPPDLRRYQFYFPDPFSATTACHPRELETFQKFNLQMTRASARNINRGIDVGGAIRVVVAAHRLGLRLQTFFKVISQLLLEVVHPPLKVRRRTFQSIFSFDIFFKYLNSQRPQFATYFTNHVASSMHRFWRAKFPDDFSADAAPLSAGWVTMFAKEIDWSMKQSDKWLGRLMDFAGRNPEYRIIVATSMGQAAVNYRIVQHELMLKEPLKFMGQFGFDPSEWQEVQAMKPQYNFRFLSESLAARFMKQCEDLRIKQRSVVCRREGTMVSIDFGQADVQKESVTYIGKPVDFAAWGIGTVQSDEESSCTAYHIPEGMMLYYHPHSSQSRKNARSRVSTLAIAPSILDFFAVPVPKYMSTERVQL